jgi:uncharacterized protein (TIGR02646 family)
MRQLERDPVPPNCLAKYIPGVNPWNITSPTRQERSDIWVKLDAMQSGLCAYCEASLTNGRHIEHFRSRSSSPLETFSWANLFGSCDRQDSCGNQKDKPGSNNPALPSLIKPDIEDPERFLVFTATGTVHARANLSAQDRLRAEETIRRLNLNGTLKQIRREVLRPYLETAETLILLAAELGGAALPMLQEELQNVAALPHATAIKHLLTNQNRT